MICKYQDPRSWAGTHDTKMNVPGCSDGLCDGFWAPSQALKHSTSSTGCHVCICGLCSVHKSRAFSLADWLEKSPGRLAYAVLPGLRAHQCSYGTLFPGQILSLSSQNAQGRQAKLVSCSYPLLSLFSTKTIGQIQTIALFPQILSLRESTTQKGEWQNSVKL
ncbi:hypothetical protein mRhiFer1_010102 [Rhinolophus ferrumequinum]|uniref:Uncharacterized protein n=1 Tax=Rhinolophus ferrumequinum TaxID=59479 RepID=A0A7J7XPM9_RHIFE|nr:hypothetical protein mRhiFer1_010102 [Rhinolophus ferrumequinum]